MAIQLEIPDETVRRKPVLIRQFTPIHTAVIA